MPAKQRMTIETTEPKSKRWISRAVLQQGEDGQGVFRPNLARVRGLRKA